MEVLGGIGGPEARGASPLYTEEERVRAGGLNSGGAWQEEVSEVRQLWSSHQGQVTAGGLVMGNAPVFR